MSYTISLQYRCIVSKDLAPILILLYTTYMRVYRVRLGLGQAIYTYVKQYKTIYTMHRTVFLYTYL